MTVINNYIYSQVEQFLLKAAPANSRIVLAYSGGADSEVLAYCLSIFAKKYKSFSYLFIHVNHSLNDAADLWVDHCRRRADYYNIALEVKEIVVTNKPRCSLEDLARSARYKAIFESLGSDDILLTAHHSDDQIETVLLALKRGSGLKGLAGIAASSRMQNHLILRPLLEISKEQILNFAAANKLHYVTDSSNLDNSFDRNFLRNKVVPLLKERWPSVNKSISRSASLLNLEYKVNCKLLDSKLAAMQSGNKLNIKLLLQNDFEMQSVLFRAFLSKNQAKMPSRAVLIQILQQIKNYQTAVRTAVIWDNHQVNVHKDFVYLNSNSTYTYKDIFIPKIDLLNSNTLHISSNSKISVIINAEKAINPNLLNGNKLSIRFGLPMSFKCQPSFIKSHIRLKHLVQKLDIPVFERPKIPYLFSENRLVSALGFWIEKEFFANINGVCIIFNVY